MLEQMSGFPYWQIEFDEDGKPIQQSALDSLCTELPNQRVVDLFIFSHGWNNDREMGQGLHPPLTAEEMMRNEHRRGYGNDATREITKRFPQPLGNLAQNARFPHSHSRSSVCQIRRA